MSRYSHRPAFNDLTIKEYKRLKREEKLTDKQIADLYFISTATLSRWKRRNEIKAERKAEEYIELRKDGYRDYQICAKWDITPSALYQWKAKRGLIGKEIA